MSDFFGEYAAPGLLIGGVGITAFRTFQDLNKRGTISSRWEDLKSQRVFHATFKANQAARAAMRPSAKDVARLFDTSAYWHNWSKKIDDTLVDVGFEHARSLAINNLISTFGLQNTLTEKGINTNFLLSKDLEQILELSPAYKEHMYSTAQRLGLDSRMRLSSSGALSKEWKKKMRQTAEGLQKIATDLSVGTLSEVMGGRPAIREAFHIGRHSRLYDVGSVEKLTKALQGQPADLVAEVTSLFSKVRQMKGVSFQLKYLDQGSQQLLYGYRISGNKGVGPIDAPIVLKDGSARLGRYGTRHMIARHVPRKGSLEMLALGRTDIAERFDVALTRHLSENIDSFIGGGGARSERLLASLQQVSRDDASKLLVPATMNKSLNRKIAQQIVFRNNPLGDPSVSSHIDAFDKLVVEAGLDAFSGLSPTQRESGVRQIPSMNRPMGVGALGVATGDDKTLSQMLRPKIITGRGRARRDQAVVHGMLQKKLGDVTPKLRTYAMPEIALRAMLQHSGGAHIGLHEDVALLLDKGIKYGSRERSISLQGDKRTSVFMEDILKLDSYSDLREAVTHPGGSSAYLKTLKKKIQSAATPEEAEALRAKISRIKLQRVIAPETILGESPKGGVIKTPSRGSFTIESMSWMGGLDETGGDPRWLLTGVTEATLGDGDKLFGMKRTLREFDSAQGEFFATLFEATKDRPEVIEALAQGDTAALSRIYSPMIEGWHRNTMYDDGLLSMEDLAPRGVDKEAWARASGTTRDLQILDTQGFKRIGERTKSQITEALMDEIVREHSSIMDRVRSKAPAGMSATDGFNAVRQSHPELFAKLVESQESLNRLGITVRPGETKSDGLSYLVDDDMHGAGPGSRKNLAQRMNQVLMEVMEEEGPGIVSRWSGRRALGEMASWSDSKFMENLQVGQAMLEESRLAIAKAAAGSDLDVGNAIADLLNGPGRRGVITAAESQIRYGAFMRAVGIGGEGGRELGMGKRGSFTLGMFRHLKQQGGVAASVGEYLLGNLEGDKLAESEEIAKRVLGITQGVGPNVKTVSMLDFASSELSDRAFTDQLFSRDQTARSQAFDIVRSKYGIESKDGLIFDLGEGRSLYHGEQIGRLSAPFTLPDGTAISSGLDTSTKDIIDAFKTQDQGTIQTAISGYEAALSEVSFGKDKALTRVFSGKVLGSKHLQSNPNPSEEFFNFINENYKNKVGISEANFQTMMQEQGLSDGAEFTKRLEALRAGEEAGFIARNPSTELHRITAMNFYSIDEAMAKWKSSLINGRTEEDLKLALSMLDKGSLNQLNAKLESPNFVEKVVGKFRKTYPSDWSDGMIVEAWYNEQLKKKIMRAPVGGGFDKGVFLPKSVEQALGADYDADPIEVFTVRKDELQSQLRERTAFKTQLLDSFDITKDHSGQDITNAIDRALQSATTPEQKLAAEDFSYMARQRQLYSSLKSKPGAVLSGEDITPGTPSWKARQTGLALMSELEKTTIGPLTNATDFVREALRAQGGAEAVDAKIFSELLLGIMPETALKARQVGAVELQRAINAHGDSVGSSIKSLQEILSGQALGLGREGMINRFTEAFTAVHNPGGESQVVNDLLRFVPRVIDAVSANKSKENLYTKFVKSSPDDASQGLRKLAAMMADTVTPWAQGEMGREAAQSLGIQLDGPAKTNMKLASNTFSDVVQLMKTHRRPALVGAGLAIGAALLLGNPGSISAEEADGAGARRDLSAPTPEPPGFTTAPVSTNGGRSIRVRARATGDIDTSRISAMMESRFGGADVSYTMNDLRTKINQEFVRKQLERN